MSSGLDEDGELDVGTYPLIAKQNAKSFDSLLSSLDIKNWIVSFKTYA